MGHSRTPTQITAGDGFPADPIDGSAHGCRRSCQSRYATGIALRGPQ